MHVWILIGQSTPNPHELTINASADCIVDGGPDVIEGPSSVLHKTIKVDVIDSISDIIQLIINIWHLDNT